LFSLCPFLFKKEKNEKKSKNHKMNNALTPHLEQGRAPQGKAYRRRSGVRAIFFWYFSRTNRKVH
jgi:hypothetical protein